MVKQKVLSYIKEKSCCLSQTSYFSEGISGFIYLFNFVFWYSVFTLFFVLQLVKLTPHETPSFFPEQITKKHIYLMILVVHPINFISFYVVITLKVKTKIKIWWHHVPRRCLFQQTAAHSSSTSILTFSFWFQQMFFNIF